MPRDRSTTPRNVVRDIGDMDAQPPAPVARRLDGDGVIEIPCVDGIDRQNEAIADIAPQRVPKGAVDVERERIRFLERPRRIAVLEVVAGHDARDAQVGGVRIADAPLDGDDARFDARGIHLDARRHDIARLHPEACRGIIRGKHEEILLDTAVERPHHPERAHDVIGPHDRGACALDNVLDHGATLAPRPAPDAGVHAVAVHGVAQTATRQPVRSLRRIDVSRMLRDAYGSHQTGGAPGARRSLAMCLSSSTHTFPSRKNGARNGRHDHFHPCTRKSRHGPARTR